MQLNFVHSTFNTLKGKSIQENLMTTCVQIRILDYKSIKLFMIIFFPRNTSCEEIVGKASIIGKLPR